MTYLEASRNDKFKKFVYFGILIAIGATAITWFIAEFLIKISGASREIIEAVAGLSAVAVLFWVSFWILNKIETKKWIEFVKAKVWQAQLQVAYGFYYAIFFTFIEKVLKLFCSINLCFFCKIHGILCCGWTCYWISCNCWCGFFSPKVREKDYH